MIKLMMA